MHAVKIACQRPDTAGRSLSQWDCAEIRRQLIADGLVESISTERVRELLASHRTRVIEIAVLAIGAAAGLTVIDVVYVARGIISPVYSMQPWRF
jgi:hypothetical protein